jgi:hypothetical protein
MRRILLSLFALCLVFTLVGCDDTPTTPVVGDTDSKPAATTDGTPVLTDATSADGAPCCEQDGAAADGSKCDGSKCGESCACKEKAAAAKTAAKACVCKAGKAGASVWCEACDKGYVDSKEVCCPSCVKSAIKKAAAKPEQ